jgi:putative ABC transport system permease protein
MFNNNLKLALQSLRSTKWRSFLTMLGVIIGVFSVTVTVSIGVGIRQQITSQIQQLGPDLITVLPGQSPTINATNVLRRVNVLPSIGTGSFNEKDLALVGATQGVRVAVPMTSITGSVSIDGTKYDGQQIIATTPSFPNVVNQGLSAGQFYSSDDPFINNEAVIGQNVADNLFKEQEPVGESFTINNQQFTVTGVLSQFTSSPLTPLSNYNNAIFIPFSVGASMSGNNPQIYEIFAKPNKVNQTNQTAAAINSTLSKEYGNQNNFTVLEQKQILKIANSTLNILTALIAAVAGISLFVGGVGIMNIMLVAVIERTREIGIRKAIGATNQQILYQFLIEAGILGLTGGIIGVILAVIADYVIKYFTSLEPAVNWQIIVISIGAALVAGLLFGTMPALRASRKDPIDSLRHE